MQARTGSRRLPGKVLADLGGRPLLARLLDRLARSTATAGVVVATTADRADDPVAELARSCGAGVVRGHPTDVLARFASVLDQTGAETIVRVSADSPFLDGPTVDAVVADFDRGGAELIENHRVAGWPVGTAVEVLSSACLRRLDAEATDPALREHVTLHAYTHPEGYSIRHLPAPSDLYAPHLRLCVDTQDDLERARRIDAAFDAQPVPLSAVVARFGRTAVA